MSFNTSTSLRTQHDFTAKLEVARWIACALWLVYFTVGLPGNLLILFVYRAKRFRTTTHVFIGGLAVADLLTCLLRLADAVAMASVRRYLDYDRQSAVNFLSRGFMYTTALLTTAIALDRFDAVCRSLCRSITLRRAKIGTVACFAVGFIGILPEAGHKIHEGLQGEVTSDTFFIRSVVKFIPVSLYILSLFAVAIFYGIIFRFVRKRGRIVAMLREASTHRGEHAESELTAGSNSLEVAFVVSSARAVPSTMSQQSPSQDERGGEGSSIRPNPPQAASSRVTTRPHPTNSQSRTTKMLFIATFLFFVLWFPNIYLKFYALGSLFKDFSKSSDHANVVAALLVLKDIVYFNSVINAFVYSIANKRFRVECQILIRRMRARL
ncbi:gastrin/cholecystokinin type B receptor-like [Patiria miniata]|uniref:G-protein coupled receptors family 1 profile domain-containing protein n=1 Tax=Patiria miniata TaxID=46514 RepID=A0A914B1L0_PATMI|nr:gastrin/cholecystokinin type B receptor-like [Patiria miniata]